MTFYCENQSFSSVYNNKKEGPLAVEQRALFVAQFMVSGDIGCPQGVTY
jgi:hypothetical protein